MYIINPSKLTLAIKSSPFKSVSALANKLHIHRNTIHYYLAGNPVINDKLTLILEALNLDARDIIQKKETPSSYSDKLASIIDKMHKTFPHVSFILFGSRARGTAQSSSDWDIGVFSKKDIPHKDFRKIALMKSSLTEDISISIDLVNLSNADLDFLQEIAQEWQFLTGNLTDWISLNRMVTRYEK
jgi:predicted nucleotidyltransferase